MLRFIVWVLLPSIIYASITFRSIDRKLTLTAPTMDYFELDMPSYNLTRCLMVQILPTDTQTDCSFAPATPLKGFNLNGDYVLDYKCTIGLLDLFYATIAGCRNIGEITLGVKKTWLPSLESVQYPSHKVFLAIVLPRIIPGTLGGPVATPYLSHDFGIPDGAPAIDTVFLMYEDARLFATQFRFISEVEATLVQEPGPWNEFFLSTGYKVYKWILFTANCLMVMYSLYRLFLASIQGTIKLDQRTVIFVGGIISAIMFAVSLTLRRQTQLFYLMEIISSFFFSVAFYLLVSLWSGLLSQVQQHSAYSPLRIGIYIGMLVATINLVFGLIWLTIWPGSTLSDIHNIMRYVTPVSQALVGLLFFFYAVRFQIRKNDHNASAYTRRALTKLAWLAVLGFITFVVKAVTNFSGGEITVAGSVGGIAAVYIATDIASTARAFAILMVLGVRLPDNRSTAHSGSTISGAGKTLMSWGGWSKGWRRAIYGSAAGESGMMSTANGGISQSTSGVGSATGYNGAKASRVSKLGDKKSMMTPMRGVNLHAGKKS